LSIQPVFRKALKHQDSGHRNLFFFP